MSARRARRLLLAGLLSGALATAASPAPPQSPQIELGDLFVAVQTSQVFADGKTFPDAVPREAPAEILAKYHTERPAAGKALEAFVEAHFILPVPVTAPPASAHIVPIDEHIDGLWSELTRSTPTAPAFSSLLPLPAPYVVPGGRFREIYYWDSYFTMLGLIESGRLDLVRGHGAGLRLLHRYLRPHSERCKDVLPEPLATAVLLRDGRRLPGGSDPTAGFARYLPELKREYAFWMRGAEGLARGTARRPRGGACRWSDPQSLLG